MERGKYEIEVVVYIIERINKWVNWIMLYLYIFSNVCIKRNYSNFLFYNLIIFMKKKKRIYVLFLDNLIEVVKCGKWFYNCVVIVWEDERLIFFFLDYFK